MPPSEICKRDHRFSSSLPAEPAGREAGAGPCCAQGDGGFGVRVGGHGVRPYGIPGTMIPGREGEGLAASRRVLRCAQNDGVYPPGQHGSGTGLTWPQGVSFHRVHLPGHHGAGATRGCRAADQPVSVARACQKKKRPKAMMMAPLTPVTQRMPLPVTNRRETCAMTERVVTQARMPRVTPTTRTGAPDFPTRLTASAARPAPTVSQ